MCVYPAASLAHGATVASLTFEARSQPCSSCARMLCKAKISNIDTVLAQFCHIRPSFVRAMIPWSALFDVERLIICPTDSACILLFLLLCYCSCPISWDTPSSEDGRAAHCTHGACNQPSCSRRSGVCQPGRTSVRDVGGGNQGFTTRRMPLPAFLVRSH